MNFFYRLSLSKKITVIILITVITVLSVGFGMSFYQDITTTKQSLLSEKILTAKIVGSYTTSDLTFNNQKTALESLSYLKKDHSIINAYIYDERDKLFVSLYKNSTPYKSKAKNTFHEFTSKQLLVIEPIYLGKQKIGTLHLVSSTEKYLNAIQKRMKYFSILIIGLVILSIVVASKLSKIVTSPILSLIDAINSFSNGDTTNYVETVNKYSDETGTLITAFNNMLLKIKEKEHERDTAELSLIEAKEHLTNVLNNLVEGVMTISVNGKIKSANQTALKMFGYSEAEFIEQPIIKLTTKAQLTKYSGHLNYYSETGDLGIIAKGFETIGVKKNQKEFPIYATIAEMPNTLDQEKCFIISCEDISHRKSQEEQLRRTQRMDALGKLTGGIAHDYNNMLGVIIGYSELIQFDSNISDKLKSYATEILHAGERGKKLTSKLLSFTKRDSSEADVTNINSIINQNQNIIEKTITSRIKLDLELEENIWQTWLDKGDLEDALINLSINAMHAMDDGGLLLIETFNIHLSEIEASAMRLPAGDYVELKVTDSGTGMDETTRIHIFEPFFTTKKDKGTGLGLSQVYGFVKRSNGEVKVYSEPGKGTHFDFYFPRFISSKTDNISTLQNDEDLNKYSGIETILVVDDELGLRKLAQGLLTHYGYHVLAAANAKEALSLLNKNKIDLMLSDIIMPGMDGYQLADVVAQSYPEIKIQLSSGFSGKEYHDLSDKNKVLHETLLRKPYRKDLLLKRVREILDS